MIAAGALFEALAGISFGLAVVLTGVFMLTYVLFGGMIAATWVQIVKAVLLMAGVVVLTVLVLRRVSWNPFPRSWPARPRTARRATGKGGNLAAPLLAHTLGGGAGSFGGDVFLAAISAVAFATILAVVAGLVMAASGAVAHDVYTNVVRRGEGSERDELRVARIAAVGVAVVAMALAILAGKGFNIQFLVR